MKKVKTGVILPSAAFTIKGKQVKFYEYTEKVPEIGDVVYGTINWIGQHSARLLIEGGFTFQLSYRILDK